MTISEIEAEFDKEYFCGSEAFQEEIKQFYRSKFTEVLKELELKIDRLPADPNDAYDQGVQKGYNFAVSDLQRKIEQTLK